MSCKKSEENLRKVLKNIIHLDDFESQEDMYKYVKNNMDKEFWLQMDNGDYISNYGNIISKKGKLLMQS